MIRQLKLVLLNIKPDIRFSINKTQGQQTNTADDLADLYMPRYSTVIKYTENNACMLNYKSIKQSTWNGIHNPFNSKMWFTECSARTNIWLIEWIVKSGRSVKEKEQKIEGQLKRKSIFVFTLDQGF